MQYRNETKAVYIVDGSRSAFLKAKGRPGPFSASDLAVYTIRELLKKHSFSPDAVGEVVAGNTMASPNEANIGRLIALRVGCGDRVPGWSVHRNCASGMQAIDSGAKDIALGRYDLVLAGGTEAMSRAPLLFNDKMVDWLAEWYRAKSFTAKLKLIFKLRPAFFAPIIALKCGLTDPVVGLNMGETAENIAYKFNISREEMDAFAMLSHQRLAEAYEKGYMDGEVVPLFDHKGNVYPRDTGLRADSSMEKLAKLKPTFDRKFGKVTAGNSSQVTDGAAFLMLANVDAIEKYQLPVLGKIIDTHWAGCDPAYMGLGPVYAATPLLQRNNLSLGDIDYWETNEAFAAQVLGCLKAWEDETFCRQELGLPGAFGSIDQARLNIDGGAVAAGHPIGASGARIVLHLVNVLQRKNAKYGIANICIGGGLGGAMLIERMNEVQE